ncbi:MAG: SusF/SusE family outer membrane protein [Muribaculaceae bacterium]|nr:SusF/SusE family outer membrane protein [Muribaculaceae bacterium]
MKKLLLLASILTPLALFARPALQDAPTPIEAENFYMVGDATPAGWDIGNPTQLTKESDYVFTYTGELKRGELKALTSTGSWDVPFVRPASAEVKISRDGAEAGTFVYTNSPDDKWRVIDAGTYTLTFDLQNYTITAVCTEVAPVTPIEADNFYIVGNATPAGWNIGSPVQLEKKSDYVFVYEGPLYNGSFKACTSKGDWGVPFFRPRYQSVEISKTGVAEQYMVYTNSPDDSWKVVDEGKYKLTFDLESYTVTAEYKGELPKEPIETETLYIIGNATTAGWDIDNPVALTKESDYVFTYEGALTWGKMKALTSKGSWEVPFLRPATDLLTISKDGAEDGNFVCPGTTDYQWLVTDAGNYKLTFDLKNFTIKAEFVSEKKDPVETETLYMVGDAAPNGWNIDDPTEVAKTSDYVFTYVGPLNKGEMKACTTKGNWDVPYFRPKYDGAAISGEGAAEADMMYCDSPDLKWKVTEEGIYTLTFDLQNFTITAVREGDVPAMPVVTVGEVTHNSASISWTCETEYVKYEYSLVPMQMTDPSQIIFGQTTSKEVLIEDLLAETEYGFSVRGIAENEKLNSDWAISGFTTTAEPEKPEVPVVTVSEVTATGATLTWTCEGEYVKYSYTLLPMQMTDPSDIISGETTVKTVTFENLKPNTEYGFSVMGIAESEEGNSDWGIAGFTTKESGIDSVNANSFSVTCSNGMLNIANNGAEIRAIDVFDTTGRRVAAYSVNTAASVAVPFDAVNGLYIVNVLNADGTGHAYRVVR